MNICILCEKEYDREDYVEDVELLEALQRYIDIEKLCPECTYKLDEQISDFIEKKLKEK